MKRRIQTWHQVIEWLETEAAVDPTDNRDIIDQAMWFFACQDAREMRDTYSAKDWAQALLHGIPKLTRGMVIKTLRAKREDDEIYDLRIELTAFWGVRPNRGVDKDGTLVEPGESR